jgi:hypothetical protein
MAPEAVRLYESLKTPFAASPYLKGQLALATYSVQGTTLSACLDLFVNTIPSPFHCVLSTAPLPYLYRAVECGCHDLQSTMLRNGSTTPFEKRTRSASTAWRRYRTSCS